MYFIIFISLFSKLILKQEIYKHQYLSIIISIFGIIFLIIPICLVFEQNDIVPNILLFIRAVCYSLYLTLIKYVIDIFYIPPLKLCLLIGIISIVINYLVFIFYSLIKYHDLSYFKDCLDFSEEENKIKIIIYIIICFLFASIVQVFTFLVIFYFSPILLMVTDIISPMLLWIATTIESGYIMPNIIMYPIGYFITLLSTLIYNEIIIFNFCGLNKNTKIFVEHRQSEESRQLSKNLTEITLENNTDNDEDLSLNSDYYISKEK